MQFEITKENEALLQKFKHGTKVYLILGPNKYLETEVRAIESMLCDIEGVTHIFPKQINITHLFAGEKYYDRGEFKESFPFWRFCTTEDAAKHAVEFVKVSGILSADWEAAIGHRDADPKNDSLEECELQMCCPVISDIRDMFLKCRKNHGLINHDIDLLKELCTQHEKPKDAVTLNKILGQLGIEWKE